MLSWRQWCCSNDVCSADKRCDKLLVWSSAANSARTAKLTSDITPVTRQKMNSVLSVVPKLGRHALIWGRKPYYKYHESINDTFYYTCKNIQTCWIATKEISTYKNFHCGKVNLVGSFPFEFAQYGATVWLFGNILDTEPYPFGLCTSHIWQINLYLRFRNIQVIIFFLEWKKLKTMISH